LSEATSNVQRPKDKELVMCWMCDHPKATLADYADVVVQPMIDRFGWAVQSVERTGIHAPFSYTVGLTRRGLPELVITGRGAAASARVLNAAARRLQQQELPRPGELLEVQGRGFEVVELSHPEAHLFVAIGLYGEDAVTALQLVWADEQRRWPWERGHGGGRGGQPVLGPRARQVKVP
jgi:hypothetical protein